jgi:hypothetical protein
MERQIVLSLGIGNLVREVGREVRRAALVRKSLRKTRPLEGPRAGSA